MKLYRSFLVALTISAFSVLGCGDSGSSDDAGSVCSECDVQNAAAIEACQEFYNLCRTDDAGTPDDCAVGARQRCGL